MRIDHSVLHFWEKKLSPYMEEIINMVLKKLHILTYSKSFIDSTIITNRKKERIEIHVISRYNKELRTLFGSPPL
ncbi:hypothetical protein KKP97_06540 [Methanothermococcus sp. SCGC AD-155-C09]|nr:hypothetical protein [Methanothermococcus sp. SCGC AD-155-C09]